MKLLFVNGCISQRGEESRTLVLARSFLDAWQARHPEAEVETVEPEALLALKPFAPEMLNDRDALAGIWCFCCPLAEGPLYIRERIVYSEYIDASEAEQP